jgi:hypothetical protein
LILGLGGLAWATSALAQSVRPSAKGGRRRREPPAIIVGRGGEGLPPAVVDMRAAIIAAVETGDITELKAVMDLNELPPETGAPSGADGIQHLRAQSADGTGKEVLDLIGRLLEGSWAALPGGRDPENNRIYVWPKFAETGVVGLGTEDGAELAALAGQDAAAAMVAAGRYRGWRLSIGADGVWHMLTRIGD